MLAHLDDKLTRSIQLIGAKHAIKKIVLFGSRARGDNKPKSDIDIAVYSSTSTNNEGIIVSDFEDLDTLLKIDIIFVNNNIDKKLIENINKEGVILYE